MRCWSCGKKLPKKAKRCQFCEAIVEAEPTEEDMEVVRDMLEQMPPEALDEFDRVFHESKDAEDFVNRIMVGECPKCGSTETSDCDKDPEIEDILVGRCYQCGQLWCTECLRLLDPAKPHCDCLEDDEEEDA